MSSSLKSSLQDIKLATEEVQHFLPPIPFQRPQMPTPLLKLADFDLSSNEQEHLNKLKNDIFVYCMQKHTIQVLQSDVLLGNIRSSMSSLSSPYTEQSKVVF